MITRINDIEIPFDDSAVPAPLTLPVTLGLPGTTQWRGSINFEMDTGSSLVAIPRQVLERLGMVDQLNIVDEIDGENADGSKNLSKLCELDLRITAFPSQTPITFKRVKCMIMDDGDSALLGLTILSQLNIQIRGGKVQLLEYCKNKND